MIADIVAFIKSTIESLEFSDGFIFSGKVYEVYPVFAKLRSLVPCAVIRHPSDANASTDESFGYRQNGADANVVLKSVSNKKLAYKVDFWINADMIEKDYMGSTDSIIRKVEDAFFAVDVIRESRTGNPIDVECLGCGIVDDPEGVAEIYKIILRINFEGKIYRSTTVQKFKSDVPIEITEEV